MEQTIGNGLFQNQMNFDPGWEDELNAWLNVDHIQERLYTPGFLSARRYVLAGDPLWGDAAVEGTFKWLHQYQLENLGVMEKPEYHAHDPRGETAVSQRYSPPDHYRIWRTVYEQVYPKQGALGPSGTSMPANRQQIGTGLLHLAMNPEAGHEEEVCGWLDEEWLPQVLELPGFLSARRFKRGPVTMPEGFHATALERWKRNQGPYEYLTVVELGDVTALQGNAYVDYRMHPSKQAQALSGSYAFQRCVYRQIYPATGACEDHSGLPDDTFVVKEGIGLPMTGGL